MTIGSKSWRERLLDKNTNIASGFRSSCIQVFYFTVMQHHMKLFQEINTVDSEENPTWMRCRETFQTEVLSLPPAIDRQT